MATVSLSPWIMPAEPVNREPRGASESKPSQGVTNYSLLRLPQGLSAKKTPWTKIFVRE